MQRAADRFGLALVLAVGAVARALPFALSVEHYGDAPVRVELAERWALSPHLWHGSLEAYQFGPVHLSLLGWALKFWPDRDWSPKALTLLFGLAGLWLLYRLARRVAGPEAALCAGLGLALSPLHIQASTSAASEAVFLALLLASLELIFAQGPLWASALFIGAAGLTRYDGWLYFGLLILLLALEVRRKRRSLGGLLLFGLIGALPIAGWLWLNHTWAHDALAPIHYIDRDHLALAASGVRWFGPFIYRLYCLIYWPLALLALCTPLLGLLALFGAARTLWARLPGWELVAIGWLPAAYLTARGVGLADFRPMARFAMVSAALSLPFAWGMFTSIRARLAPRAARALIAATALVLVATPISLSAASRSSVPAVAEWARPLSPVSSVPDGIEQAARYLRGHAGRADVVLLDSVWDYLDLPLAFSAGLPDHQWIRLRWTDDFAQRLLRNTPTYAVLLYQGDLRNAPGAVDATEDQDRFSFRGLRFCKVERYLYATVYQRCQ